MSQKETLRLFITQPHVCSYLPDRQATTIVTDPEAGMDTLLYGELADHGFRRSGTDVYRPACEDCSACTPVRIPVQEFQYQRRDRRVLNRNAGVVALPQAATFRNEHYSLYERYIGARHAGGGMDNPSPESYLQFLRSDWCQTEFIEFRQDGQLLAVAVTDVLPRGLSAVYTFYEPGMSRLSLGTFTILWQIAEARRRKLPFLYLGYWIEACQKMRYKGQFRPLEVFRDQHWSRLVDP